MPERSDITIDFSKSPRIVRVAPPSVELNVQDLHDTLRDLTDEPSALAHPHLINSSGKEPLGDGVLVGLTSTLQDAVLAFDARKSPIAQGTVTTPDPAGEQLEDSAASFADVEPGAWVVNFTDGSVCSVVTVVSETIIVTDGLEGGTNNQFNSADSYKVWNVIQCNVSGGNLVAVDALAVEAEAILPTMGTQVVKTSSVSATLQELADLQFTSFQGGVTVKAGSGNSGTAFPTGTPRQPVDNIPDALLIAAIRGFHTLFFEANFTFDTGDIIDGFALVGHSPTLVLLTFNAGATITNSEIRSSRVTGMMDGGVTFVDCHIFALTGVDGHIHETILGGSIVLAGGATTLHMLECRANVQATGPVIDFNGSGTALGLEGWHGELTITNKTGPEHVQIDLHAGVVRITSSVTGGTITVRGVGTVIDDATGDEIDSGPLNTTATLVNETVSSLRQGIIELIARNKLVTNQVTGKLELFAPDGTTILLEADIFQDALGTTPYAGAGIERRERLVTP